MDDLKKMLADYANKGGKVTVLPATKYEEIVGDDGRNKFWGETTDEKRKRKAAQDAELTVIQESMVNEAYGGLFDED